MSAKPAQKLKSELKQFIQKMSSHPCAVCGGPADGAAGWVPEHPEVFRLGPGECLCIPICQTCLDAGEIDLEWQELLAMRYFGIPVI